MARLWLGFMASGAALAWSVPGAWAMQMMSSFPAAQETVDGRNTQYVVRFDMLVDHQASRLMIVQNGKIIEMLRPLLRSEPDALAAFAPRLPAGDYRLQWSARSSSGETNEGSLPFTVKP